MGRRQRFTELRARIAGGEKKAALAREFGISRETLYAYAPVSWAEQSTLPSNTTSGPSPILMESLHPPHAHAKLEPGVPRPIHGGASRSTQWTSSPSSSSKQVSCFSSV